MHLFCNIFTLYMLQDITELPLIILQYLSNLSYYLGHILPIYKLLHKYSVKFRQINPKVLY